MEPSAPATPVSPRGLLRAKLFALVGVGLCAALLCAVVGFLGTARTHAAVITLDRRSVDPLAALGTLRDADGDSRVNVWAYLAPGADRTAVGADIQVGDEAVQAAIDAYFAAHGSHTDADGQLMTSFASDYATWKQVRDTVVRPAADAGNTAAAYAGVHGPLKQANIAMAAPLDTLFAAQTAASHRTSARADGSYRLLRIGLVVVMLVGVLVAVLAGWWVTRRILATVGVVRQGLARLAARDLSDHRVEVVGSDELAEMARATATAAAGMRTVIRRLFAGVATLDGAVERLSAGSVSMEGTSALAADQARGATSAVSRVDQSVQTVAAGTEQMSAAIHEIARNSQEAARVAQQAAHTASSTDEQVRRLGASPGPGQRRDRQGHQGDHVDCPADEPAGPERHHRGRPRR